MMWRLALLLVLVFMPVAFGLPDEAVGRVVSVISGDSLGIEMLIADARTNNIDSIKLADIEAPSTVTAEGKAAQKYAFSLLKNKTVYLDINDNTSGTRNEWSQLICVIYLMDSEFRPVWPPVNRILVDGGYARLNDDVNNEFNSSAWWQQPPDLPAGRKERPAIGHAGKTASARTGDRCRAFFLSGRCNDRQFQKGQHFGEGQRIRADEHRISQMRRKELSGKKK